MPDRTAQLPRAVGVRRARLSLVTLLLVAIVAPPAGAQEVQDPAPVVEAITDLARCGAHVEAIPGSDKCEAWAVRQTGASVSSFPMSVAVSPVDGTVFTMGVTQGEIQLVDDMDIAGRTTAHDPETGEVLWTAATQGPQGVAMLESIAVAPDGSRVFIAGYTKPGLMDADYLVQALDPATGLLVWEATYDGPGVPTDSLDTVKDMTVSGSRVIVTGFISAADGSRDGVTVAYDGATGEQLWETRFDGVGERNAVPVAVATSPDGSLTLITGQRETGPGIADSYIVAYDTTTGDEVWKGVFDGPNPGWHGPDDLVVSQDAVFVATTIHDTSNEGREWATVAYDLGTGRKLWSSMYVVGLGGWSAPSAIAVTPNGARVFVTGISDNGEGGAGRDYTTVGYDALSGSQLWVARYDGPAGERDQAYSIVVSPDGSSVIVTGQSDTGPRERDIMNSSGPGWDFATIAYDAVSGGQQWMARYNAAPFEIDVARDLALSPSGDAVYVTGSGLGPPRGGNAGEVHFQTVAYDLES